jgi:hypothetical protein
MKAYGGVDVEIHISLTSALVGVEWSASRPCCFTPGERAPCTNLVGGWMNPRAGLDDVEKKKFLTLPRLNLRPLRRSSRNQSLYRLPFRDSCRNIVLKIVCIVETINGYELYNCREGFTGDENEKIEKHM